MQSLHWRNSWLTQPAAFYQRVLPTPLQRPYFVHCNEQAAQLLGLTAEQLGQADNLRCLSGEQLLPDMQPIATVYAGHQFGIFTSKLGDGRAILLGEAGHKAEKYEIQLKGAGLTPYSRTLNGQYTLGSAIREYLVSEALSALGIPCTRALCLLGSHTQIANEPAETGAILVRMARSHIRFGHFEYFHHRDDFTALAEFFNFVIEQHFPALLNESPEQRPIKFLRSVILRTARLIALWQSIGFTHGVMNTDNMTISGETLDLGPCGFMQAYNAEFTPNPLDDQHRYQFDQQPDIGRWNCLALAQALTSLLAEPVIPAGLLRLYRQAYQQHYLQNMRGKLGLQVQNPGDIALINSLQAVLTSIRADYTHFFRQLSRFESGCKSQDLFPDVSDGSPIPSWLDCYQQRLSLESVKTSERHHAMKQLNPCFILREQILNEVIQETEKGDFGAVQRLMIRLQNPYEE